MHISRPSLSFERAAMLLVVVSSSVNAVTGDALVPALPAIAHEIGGHNGAYLAQMILVVPSFSIIIGSPMAGWLGRRLGLARLARIAVAVYILAGIFGAFAPNYVSLIISRLALGLVSGMLGTLLVSQSSLFDNATRARLLGYANATAATTSVLSFIIGGFLTTFVGWRGASLTYLWPLLILPWLLKGVPKYAPTASVNSTAVEDDFPFAKVLPIIVAAIFFFMFVFASMIMGPFLLKQRGLIDTTLIGLAISSSAITCVGVAACYGFIDRIASVWMQFLAFFVFSMASALVISNATTPLWTVFGITISGAGSGLLSPLLMSRLLRIVPLRHAATASGMLISATYLSVFLAPSAYQLLAFGGASAYHGLAVVSGVCAVITLVVMLKSQVKAPFFAN